jgi:hypothetical protein
VQTYHDASTREFALDSYYINYLLDMPPGTALPSDAGSAQQPDIGGDQSGDHATLVRSPMALQGSSSMR